MESAQLTASFKAREGQAGPNDELGVTNYVWTRSRRHSSFVIPNRPGQPFVSGKTARSQPQDARPKTRNPRLGTRNAKFGTRDSKFGNRNAAKIELLSAGLLSGNRASGHPNILHNSRRVHQSCFTACISRASRRASRPRRARLSPSFARRKKNRPAFAGRFYAEGPKCRGRDQNRGRSTAAWRTSMVRQPRSFDVTSGRSASAAGPALASLNPPVLKLTPVTRYVESRMSRMPHHWDGCGGGVSRDTVPPSDIRERLGQLSTGAACISSTPFRGSYSAPRALSFSPLPE